MNYDKIGSFIAEKRKSKKLTQKELSLKIGVTDKAVSKWERGLGCPDVSILEILAKELDVSILEILKGRIIENEVIPITEMNDYVKETVQYSNRANKNKIKEIMSKIISFIIVLICSILIILNVIHYVYLNYSEEWNFDSKDRTEMRQNIDKIEKNIDIIKNNQGIYSDEDYRRILINLKEDDIKNYKNFSIFQYSGTKKLKLNDLYIMDLERFSILATADIFRVISKYDESINDYLNVYIDMITLKNYIEESIYSEPELSYKYQIFNIPTDYYEPNPSLYRLPSRIYDYKYSIDTYLYLTNSIIEVGEMHG